MSVQDPGMLMVECDGQDSDDCDGEMDMNTTQYVGSPPSWGVSEETLEENGWLLDGDQTYCPKCRKEYE
jgi:hypothetical protein